MKPHNAPWMLTLSVLLLSPLAHAQQCPAGLSSPFKILDGTTWAFQTQSAEFSFLVSPGVATVGKFTATQTGPATGTIAYTETVDNGGNIARADNGTGRYIVNSDCSGGELIFNTSAYPVQYEFVFARGFTEIYLTADTVVRSVNNTEWGTAKLSVTSACPAGANPLSALDGTTWSFHAESALYLGPVGGNLAGGAVVGIINPVMKNNVAGTPAGVLTATETVNIGGSIARQDQISGRYLINSDCSGGEILTMQSSLPVRYEFVFVDNTFREAYLLADVNTNAGSMVLGGHAKQF